MMLPSIVFFFSRRPLIDTPITAVVADPVYVDVFNARVIGVVNDRLVHVIHVGVVVKMIMIPPAAFVAVPPIAKSIIDPAIKSNVRTPISFVPQKRCAAPTPISRRPKEAGLRSQDPSAGHPVIIISIPSPITGRPDIALRGTDRLLINGKRRRTKRSRNPDLREGSRRHSQQDHCEYQRPNYHHSPHRVSFCLLILFAHVKCTLQGADREARCNY